jgi:hypothetical protein
VPEQRVLPEAQLELEGRPVVELMVMQLGQRRRRTDQLPR